MATKVNKTPLKKGKKSITSKQKTGAKKVNKKKLEKAKVAPKKNARLTTEAEQKSKIPNKKTFSSSALEQNVSMPANMSIAQKKKAEAMRLDIHEYIHKSVNFTAFVSAVCFIVVGSFAVIASSKVNNSNLSARVIDTETYKEENVIKDKTDTEVEEVVFNFLDVVPGTLRENFSVSFVTSGVEKTEAKLVKSDNSSYTKLEVNNLLNDKYRTIIPAKTMDAGYYELRIYLHTNDPNVVKIEATKEFYIGNKNAVVETETQKQEVDSDSTITDETDEEMDPSDLEINESKKVSEKEPEKSVELEVEEVVSNPSTNHKFELGEIETMLSGQVKLEVINPNSIHKFVELYARPTNSTDYQFLALAKKRTSGWFFEIDTTNLPNGQYELFGSTKMGSRTVKTDYLRVYVNNDSIKTNELSDELIADIEKEASSTERTFVTTREYDLNQASSTELQKKIDNLIQTNSVNLDESLKRYATALQAGDELLITQAANNIDTTRSSLVKEAMLNEDTGFLSDDIDLELQNRMKYLQSKVEEFENIRQERSSGNTAKDTDMDGVSDIDEVKIYNTDPFSPDTDNDGINDGVEIVDGYDPRDSSPEAVVVFESPVETIGLEKNDDLVIESIRPIFTNQQETDSDKMVRTEITGRGLPLSFVTIYIFSSPTVVTIKTQSDGSFVYTFDKELEDGEHNVYVAMTNNSGSIIAQSSPFSFVKEAEAFTFSVENETKTLTASNNEFAPVSQTYNIVLGFSVLTLGTILLMLGFGLRKKSIDVETNDRPRATFYTQK